MSSVLVPGAIGAAGGYAISEPGKGLDRTSAMIWGTAAALGVKEIYDQFQNGGGTVAGKTALGVAIFSLIAYDRWHDGMWPFYDEERHQQAFGVEPEP